MEQNQSIDNYVNNSNIENYIGGNQYIFMFQDKEREFVVTHESTIKPVSYFVGRETELKNLRQIVEQGRKSILVSGMGGIGKTHLCRKLFEEYYIKHDNKETIPFEHIGYIEYDGDMGSSLLKCLKYKKQEKAEQNLEAAWRELEYLVSDGKLLLFVDNVNVPIRADEGLQRLKSIPGAIILTSRRTTFSKEFEVYPIGFLTTKQCREIYEKIRFKGSKRTIKEEEKQELEYIIEKLAARHTLTVELLAHLAQTKHWTVKQLREELEKKGFQLEYKDEEDKLVNIQKSYETLYKLSELTKAEQNILEAFSVFPYAPLSAEICNEWLLSDAGVEEKEDTLTGLYRKGWLQFNIEWESYTMHPVFAQFIYEKCKPKEENHIRLIKACQESLKVSENGSALGCEKFISFAENIIEKIDMEIEKQGKFISNLAYLLQYIGEYRKAEELYTKALKICEEVLGEKHPDTASSYNNLAEVYTRQEEYKKALDYFFKAYKILVLNCGLNHPTIQLVYGNMKLTYKKCRKWKLKKNFEKWLEEKMKESD